MHKFLLTICTLGAIAHAEKSARSCAVSLQKDRSTIYLTEPDARISGAESLPVLDKIGTTLERYVKLIAMDRSTVAKVFQPILPSVMHTLAEVGRVRALEDPSQDEIHALVYAFTRIVDFPSRFTSWLADRCDLGLDGLHVFNARGFAEFACRYGEGRFLGTPLEQPLMIYANHFNQNFSRPKKDLRYTKYLIAGHYDEKPDKQIYFYQYKYVAGVGFLSLEDLFQDRERGIANYAVSVRPSQMVDGQYNDSELFLDHDLFHAFLMKFRDLELFRRLGVSTLDGARAVKALNNELLQKRLEEWHALEAAQPNLFSAIKGLFFGMLHEQAHTYPHGVQGELTDVPRTEFWRKAVCRYAERGEFGRLMQARLKPDCEKLMDHAIAWLRSCANADASEFKNRFAANNRW